jgi:hypothetical protein
MAVKLTSTGIQFSDGTTATYDTSLKPTAVASSFSGTNIYTFSSISASMKRMQLQVYDASPVSGPPVSVITASNGTANLSVYYTNVYATSSWTTTGYSNQTDLMYGPSYRSIAKCTVTIEYIGTNPTGAPTYSLEWQAYNSSRYSSGFGYMTSSSSAKLSSLTLNCGPNFSNFTGCLYVEI